jgi:hypothetical protein
LNARLCGEASPSVDFTHGNLARSQRQTEQHGGGFSAGSQAPSKSNAPSTRAAQKSKSKIPATIQLPHLCYISSWRVLLSGAPALDAFALATRRLRQPIAN